jgi:hypothetical protein
MLGRVARIEESYRVVEDAPDRETTPGDVPAREREL